MSPLVLYCYWGWVLRKNLPFEFWVQQTSWVCSVQDWMGWYFGQFSWVFVKEEGSSMSLILSHSWPYKLYGFSQTVLGWRCTSQVLTHVAELAATCCQQPPGTDLGTTKGQFNFGNVLFLACLTTSVWALGFSVHELPQLAPGHPLHPFLLMGMLVLGVEEEGLNGIRIENQSRASD